MSKYFSARKVYCYSCCLFQVSSKKEAVFRNIVTIMLFGAIGTAISRTVITLGTYVPLHPISFAFESCFMLIIYGGA